MNIANLLIGFNGDNKNNAFVVLNRNISPLLLITTQVYIRVNKAKS
jgi:hypothetical protein